MSTKTSLSLLFVLLSTCANLSKHFRQLVDFPLTFSKCETFKSSPPKIVDRSLTIKFYDFVDSALATCVQSGHAGEFHPCISTEPYVKVSLFMALHVKITQNECMFLTK